MATSSILGGSLSPEEISGKDIQALGPSDNSDSGSDAVGAYSDDELTSSSDAAGTGERASVDPDIEQNDADILPDQIKQALVGQGGHGINAVVVEDSAALNEVEDLVDGTGDALTDEDDESDDAGKKG